MVIFNVHREKQHFLPSLSGKAVSHCKNHFFSCELSPQCQDTPSGFPRHHLGPQQTSPVVLLAPGMFCPTFRSRLVPAPCEASTLPINLPSNLLGEDPVSFGLLMRRPPTSCYTSLFPLISRTPDSHEDTGLEANEEYT